MSTSQLHLCRHMGSPSLSTQGIINPATVGSQGPQPLPTRMAPTMGQFRATSKHLLQVCQEPRLLQGCLQPRQHRSLVAREDMASLAKEMYRMGLAPLFKCKGSPGLSHLGQPHWPLWSASQLCFSPMALPPQVHR